MESGGIPGFFSPAVLNEGLTNLLRVAASIRTEDVAIDAPAEER